MKPYKYFRKATKNLKVSPFSLHILLTNTEITEKEDLLFHLSTEINLTPVPSTIKYQSVEEYMIADSDLKDIDISISTHKFIYVFTVDMLENQIEGTKRVEVDIQYKELLDFIDESLTVSWKLNRGTSLSTSAPLDSGILVLQNTNAVIDEDNVSKRCREMLVPHNYHNLYRYYTDLHEDQGHGEISKREGIKGKYEHLRHAVMFSHSAELWMQQYDVEEFKEWVWTNGEAEIRQRIEPHNTKCEMERPESVENEIRKWDNKIVVNSKEKYEEMRKSIFDVKFESKGFEEAIYLYFGRNNWKISPSLTLGKEEWERVLSVGPPRKLLPRIWLSMGKAPLLQDMIFQLLKNSHIQITPGKFLTDILCNICPKAIIYFPKKVQEGITRVPKEVSDAVQAYFGLSSLLQKLKEDPKTTNNILTGFTLKSDFKILSLAINIDSILRRTQNPVDSSIKNITKADIIFYILLSLATIIFPEHFLQGRMKMSHITSDPITETRRNLGIEYTHQPNKMFIGSCVSGNYKMALLLPKLIETEINDVYLKLVGMSFPFVSFAFEHFELLLSDLLDEEILFRVLNIFFFEGSHSLKRRSQQYMLCCMLLLFKKSRKRIMESKSISDVIWHIKTEGQINQQATQFMSDVYELRMAHLVESSDFDAIKYFGKFVAINMNIEDHFKTLKNNVEVQLALVQAANLKYIKYLIACVGNGHPDDVEAKLKSIPSTIDHLRIKVDSVSLKMDTKSMVPCLYLKEDGGVNYRGLLVKQKPDELSVSFLNLVSGNYSYEKTLINISASFSDVHLSLNPKSVRFANIE